MREQQWNVNDLYKSGLTSYSLLVSLLVLSHAINFKKTCSFIQKWDMMKCPILEMWSKDMEHERSLQFNLKAALLRSCKKKKKPEKSPCLSLYLNP